MGIDQNERRRQYQADRPTTKRHPYVAIDHRIIDSGAYADLGFAARDLLVLMARQLGRDNNGHLQATFSWCKRYGFGSEHTLKKALAELISHGFVYRTRSHGANGAWARYALTWLPIKKRDELFLDGFVPNAWKYWQPEPKPKKAASRKCRNHPAESAVSPPNFPQKMQEPFPQKMQSMNHGAMVDGVSAAMSSLTGAL